MFDVCNVYLPQQVIRNKKASFSKVHDCWSKCTIFSKLKFLQNGNKHTGENISSLSVNVCVLGRVFWITIIILLRNNVAF